MKKAFWGLFAALFFVPVGFAASKVVCTKTGKDVTGQCCCTVKSDKFLCSFTGKTYDMCCCQPKS
jgi:hypothetical protein